MGFDGLGTVERVPQHPMQGEYVKTPDGTIFGVIGISHPPHAVICYPKYRVQQPASRRAGPSYRKITTLAEAYAFLRRHHPEHLVYDSILDAEVCEVARTSIHAVYSPEAKLQALQKADKLDAVERDAKNLAATISKAAHVAEGIGVTGSVLLGLHNANSDIDLAVYGYDNSRRVHATLTRLLRESKGEVKPCVGKALRALYATRSKENAVGWNRFRTTESRKVLQGTFRGRLFYARLMRLPRESADHYGSVVFRAEGRATVKAIVEDASESIFTPCKYAVGNVAVLSGDSSHASEVKEIASFRGRFCEMAQEGETVIASGKVERVQSKSETYHRLLLGGSSGDAFITQGAHDV